MKSMEEMERNLQESESRLEDQRARIREVRSPQPLFRTLPDTQRGARLAQQMRC